MNAAPDDTRSSWRTEYRRSLKALETEEPLDLALYRPLAFVVARLLASTRVTANQVSLSSLFFGLLAGVLLWAGDHVLAILGAGSYFLCNVLDCADGQLARLKGTASPIGYIVDGSIDYLATIAVFLGVGHSLAFRAPHESSRWWLLATAWIASFAWQCAFLDRKRHEWMSRVYGKRSNPDQEIAEFRALAEAWRQSGTHAGGRLLISLYLGYRVTWGRVLPAEETPAPEAGDPGRWAELHRPVLRMAVMIGPTMQMTLVMLAALADRFDWLVAIPLTVGNLWGVGALLLERRANRSLRGERAGAG